MANTIYLIRHGQASFMAENYDQLSPLGYAQAEALGKWWKENLPVPNHIAHGTLDRQRQTWESFREAGSPQLPPARIIEGLNEHQGTDVLKYHRGKSEAPAGKKETLQQFFKMNMLWLAGEIDSGPYEAWADFQLRVRSAFEPLFAELEPKQSIAVLTSGGVIATAIGMALGLRDEKIMELNWQIRNSSISILHYAKGRLFLRDYNWVPHLSKEQITYV
ncbi:MAG: histidine phosphatase family protein [Bacteroidota bacterium]